MRKNAKVRMARILIAKAVFVSLSGECISPSETRMPPNIPEPKTQRPMMLTKSSSTIPYGATS